MNKSTLSAKNKKTVTNESQVSLHSTAKILELLYSIMCLGVRKVCIPQATQWLVAFPRMLRERPLMTSDFRVGRGFKMTQKIGRFRVEKGR